ncbi:MAG: hypothetical protein ABIB93_01270 [Chloroflexota bacterium]
MRYTLAMNKKKKVADIKHRRQAKKLEEKRKQLQSQPKAARQV